MLLSFCPIQDDTLTIEGEEVDNADIQLYQGWNLVGYNSLETQPLEEALFNVATYVTSVCTYDSGMAGGHWLIYIC